MMKPCVFLRDDDANATTDPAQIQRVYAPLLDAGLPINLAVIPEVALDTPAPDGQRERFVHEDAPFQSSARSLTPDSALAAWLRANAEQLDVLQHGWTHARVRGLTEFGSLSHEEAQSRIAKGHDTLTRAYGRAPAGFVAPWDALSKGAMQAAVTTFPLVSTGWVGRARLPVRAWPAHAIERLTRREVLRVDDAWVLRHRGGRIGEDTRAEDVPGILRALTDRARVAVVVLHHWMFPRGQVHPAVRALAAALRGMTVLRASDLVPALA